MPLANDAQQRTRWGTVVGTLSDQSDLQTALNAKINTSEIGSSVQAWDAQLDTWATISPSANGASLVSAANYAAMKVLLDLEIGIDVLAQQSIGIADNYLLEVDGAPNSGEYARFTANGLDGRTEAEFKGDFNLEIGTDVQAHNTQLDNFAGSNITVSGDDLAGVGALSMDGALRTDAIELGHETDTTIERDSAGVMKVEGVVIPSISSTNTLTNKRVTKRVATATDDATAVIDSDSYDEYYLTAIENATEISVTGTPTIGQTVFIGLEDAGVSKGLTWTGITALGVTLPTDTIAGKQHIIGIKYIASAWRAIAVGVDA